MQPSTTSASQRVMIVNRKGLHARASARLSRLAGEFDANVVVHHENQSADARSIMDLLMLVAHMGCEVELTAEGPEAAEAVTALAALIAEGFGEQGPDDVVC